MEHYLPLVKANSDCLVKKLPNEVEIDDLISAGIDGLRDALKNFDLDRGVKFEAYCATHIRGAILDALRNRDLVPRAAQARVNQLAEARRELQTKLGRPPTDEETANFLGLAADEYEKILRVARAFRMLESSSLFAPDDRAETAIVGDLEGAARVLRRDEREGLRRFLTKGLSKEERLILILLYYEEMEMKEIGATLGLSESRVSQLHSDILRRSRGAHGDPKDDLAPPDKEMGKPDEAQAALSLYFDLSEFSALDVVEIIGLLSDLYESVGGDVLVIDHTETYALDPALIPEGV